MTYLASTDLPAVRSLAAEHAFSLSHRTDLPPQRRSSDQSDEVPRARIFTSAQPPKPTLKPAPSTSALPAPKGKHHRRPDPTTAEKPTTEPEPAREALGYTVIDLRHRRVHWQYTPTNSQGDHHPDGYGMLIDLDAYRAHTLARLRPAGPPRTPLHPPAGQMRRRSSRVRGYVRDLVPDERAEFATLRNTIRRYLDQKERRAA